MVIQVSTQKAIDQVCDALQKAIVDRKFGVVAVHNMKETMAKKGVDFGPECRVYEVCQPGYAKQVLEANMTISTALPCRISIYTQNDEVVLATLKPTMLLEMFGSEGLEGVAQEVETVLVDSMHEAAGV